MKYGELELRELWRRSEHLGRRKQETRDGQSANSAENGRRSEVVMNECYINFQLESIIAVVAAAARMPPNETMR